MPLRFMNPDEVGKLHDRIKTQLEVNEKDIYNLVNQITQWSVSERRPISEFIDHDLVGKFQFLFFCR